MTKVAVAIKLRMGTRAVTDGLDRDWTPPEASDPGRSRVSGIFKGVHRSFEMSIEC